MADVYMQVGLVEPKFQVGMDNKAEGGVKAERKTSQR